MIYPVQISIELDQIDLARLLDWLQAIAENADDSTLLQLTLPGKGTWNYTGSDSIEVLRSAIEIVQMKLLK